LPKLGSTTKRLVVEKTEVEILDGERTTATAAGVSKKVAPMDLFAKWRPFVEELD
jgi:hypothetical protein